MTLQKSPGMRRLARSHLFRRAGDHDLATGVTAFGSQVDDVVCGLDHVHVMFDRQHGMSGVDQAMQAVEQALDIGEMEAGGRLVENVQRVLGALEFAQFRGQLDALSFAARIAWSRTGPASGNPGRGR